MVQNIFQCNNQRWVHGTFRCDGYNDSVDYSDQLACESCNNDVFTVTTINSYSPHLDVIKIMTVRIIAMNWNVNPAKEISLFIATICVYI